MRALVTGGAGFIGSNLVDALLDRGDEVLVVDNLATGKRENLSGALSRGAGFEEADIRDADRMRSVFAAARPDIVFHLAAQIDVRKSIEDPAWDAGVNVVGTINVLEAARLAGVKRVVNTSTGGAIYGEAEVMPTPETAQPRPMAAYGQSKFCAEAYCGWYERLYGLSSVILRYGNVYGPRQDPHGEAGVVAIFCGKVLAGETPLIFGDGRQTRDYVYVGDVVRGQPRGGRASRGPRRLQHRHRHRGDGHRRPQRAAPGRGAGRRGVPAGVRPGAHGRAAAQLARRDAGPRGAGLHRRHRPGGGHEAHARVGAARPPRS